MTIPFLQVKPRAIKLKVSPRFPAQLLGGTGIDVVKSNGNYTVDLAYPEFAPPVGGITDPTHQNALLWNSATNQYVLAPISVIAAGGGVPEAPNDGTQYGRQSLGWTPVAGSTPSNANPAMDGVAAPGVSLLYTRGDHVHPTDTSRAPLVSPVFTGDPKAPTPSPGDNDTSIATTAFVASAVAAGGGGGVPEAPNDGQLYGRKSLGWSVVPAGGGGGSTIIISDTAPTGVPAGTLWWKSSTGQLFIYYADPDSSEWVSAVAVPDPSNYVPASGGVRFDIAQALTAAQSKQARDNIGAVLHGYLYGLTLSTAGASATFSVAAGVAADSTASDKMALPAALAKTTAAWAAGSGNGALDTGTVAANTWYGAFLIKNIATGVVDVVVTKETAGVAPAPALPGGYTLFRYIGSMKTDGSSQWIKFSQLGDEFLWDTQVQDTGSFPLTGGAASLVTVTTPPGVQTSAWIVVEVGVAATTAILISSPDTADVAASLSRFTLVGTATFQNPTFFGPMRTDTSSRVRVRTDVTAGGGGIMQTRGWIDRRGRDG